MNEIRVAVYLRVSTKDKQDPENQRRHINEYCQRQNWTIVEEYGDKVSGKASDNRDDFQRLMMDASRRRFEIVLTWALDRLSREGVAETFQHIARLKSYGVEYESYTEPHFRTTGPAGELMIAVAAWIAKQERVRLHERITAGVERAQAQGIKFGRAGWKTRPGYISPEQKEKVLAMAGQRSQRQIAVATGLGKGTVFRILNGAPRNVTRNAGSLFDEVGAGF